jgi:hypothetical protein
MTITGGPGLDARGARTELRILDAVHHGRELARHLAELELADELRAELVGVLEGLERGA